MKAHHLPPAVSPPVLAPSPAPDDCDLLDLVLTPEPEGTALPSGRRVFHSVDGADEYVHVSDPEGRLELTIRFGPDGPILEMKAASLRLAARDIVLEAARAVRVTGAEVEIAATRGDLRAEARGDLHIDGTAVLINC